SLFNGLSQLALVTRAGAGDPARDDLAGFSDIGFQGVQVLVVDPDNTFRSKAAELATAEKTGHWKISSEFGHSKHSMWLACSCNRSRASPLAPARARKPCTRMRCPSVNPLLSFTWASPMSITAMRAWTSLGMPPSSCRERCSSQNRLVGTPAG